MAGNMTDWLENKLIDHLFRGRSYTAPTQLWVALFTTTPSDTGGGTEVSGGSYQRKSPGANSDTAWKATQGGTPAAASSGTSATTSNPTAITFDAPTANWGTVNGIAIMDAATSGNMLFWIPLTTPKTINNGDAAPSFAIDALSIQLDT